MVIYLHYPHHIRRPRRHLGPAPENHVPNLLAYVSTFKLALGDKRTVDK
jgi:hypothetical protein